MINLKSSKLLFTSNDNPIKINAQIIHLVFLDYLDFQIKALTEIFLLTINYT